MAMPKILCTVRALHSFHSPEQSSLSFKKGDIIDVLSQLESGWWDGWCNGARGWFPSNYVEMVNVHSDRVLPTAGSQKSQKLQQQQQQQQEQERQQFLESPTTEFISEEIGDYLYDPVTGSVQYRPRNGSQDFCVSDRDSEKGIRLCNGSIIDSDSDDDGHDHYEDAHDIQKPPSVTTTTQEEDLISKWVERVTPQGRTYYCNLITQETTWDRNEIDPTTGRLKNLQEESEDSDDDIPTMKRKQSRDESSCIVTAVTTSTLSSATEPITWQKLSGDVAMAIHQLNLTVHQNLRDLFVEHTALVVETIRTMLYAAGLMDQVSHYTQDSVLRGPHRALMAALSKLVLSAKIASDLPLSPMMNPSGDTNNKLQKDSGDVLEAVRNFVTACQQRDVRVEQVTIRFVKEGKNGNDSPEAATAATSSIVISDPAEDAVSNDRADLSVATSEDTATASSVISNPTPPTPPTAKLPEKTKYWLNQDLIVNLQSHANQLYGSTGTVSSSIAQIAEIQHEEILSGAVTGQKMGQLQDSQLRNSVIVHFKTILKQMSQFLPIVEAINLDDVEVSKVSALARFKLEKQALYDAFGNLFGAIQTMSNPSTPFTEGMGVMDEANDKIVDGLERLLHCVQQMVDQRRMWQTRQGASDKDLSDIASQGASDIVSSGIDYDSDTLDEGATVISSGSSNLLSPSKSSRRTPRQPRSVLSDSIPSSRQRQPSTKPDTTATTSAVAAVVASTTTESVWFLGHDHSASEVVFAKDGNIKGGTLPALVERLTLHDTLDTSFIANFLLTYRSFATTEEFVTLLEGRYTMTAPEGLTPQELETWTKRKQKLIRLRVFNVMKNWLENYYIDEDEAILDRLEFFSNTVIRDTSSFSADQLQRLINKRRELDADDHLKKLVPNNMEGPTPILPKNLSSNTPITLLDTDTLELARQLSILDFKLYSSIRPIECLNKAWSRDDCEIAVHVKQSIDYCNRLTAWVTGSILEHAEAKKRVVVIKYWAQVAERCRQLNNYNTCMAIFSAFDNSAVGRLRRTWEIVGNRTTQTLSQIRKLMGANKNFTEYREMIHSVNPPCIPFLGIYLQDLTFIEDGNPDFLATSDHLINFAKRQKTAEVIREIKQFQSSPYTLHVVQSIQDFIQAQLESSLDVEELYERSLEIEPKAPTAAVEAARLLEMIN